MNTIDLVSSGIAKAQNLSAASRRFSEAARNEVLATIVIAKENGLIVRRGRPSLNPTPFDIKARMVLLDAYIKGMNTITSDYVVEQFIKDGYVSANKGGIQSAVRVALSTVKNNNAFDTGGQYQTVTKASKNYSLAFTTMNLETGELDIVAIFNGTHEATLKAYCETHKVMSMREIKKDSDVDLAMTKYMAVKHYNALARKYNLPLKSESNAFNKAWAIVNHEELKALHYMNKHICFRLPCPLA